jgi:hypothetical protein
VLPVLFHAGIVGIHGSFLQEVQLVLRLLPPVLHPIRDDDSIRLIRLHGILGFAKRHVQRHGFCCGVQAVLYAFQAFVEVFQRCYRVVVGL